MSGKELWKPTPHGQTLAEALERFDVVSGQSVLELGGGVANHTIIMARQGPRLLVTTEILPEFLSTTQQNVEKAVPGCQEFMEYRVCDWLDTHGRFDVIVTNPPFAKSGQRNRRYFIDALILGAHRRLNPEGEIVFVQSSMADLGKTQRRLQENGFVHEVIHETEGPFRDYYFEDASFMKEIQGVPHGFEIRDGVYYERLFVIRGRLEPWTPPAGAHVFAS